MDFNELPGILVTLVSIIGIAAFFYFYYTSEKVKEVTGSVLRFAPAVLHFLASKIKNKPKEFDMHDALVLTGRTAQHISDTVTDPANASFDDVQDDLVAFIRTELARYRDAGVQGVPDENEEALRAQVRVVFEEFQRMTNEDTAGNDSTD